MICRDACCSSFSPSPQYLSVNNVLLCEEPVYGAWNGISRARGKNFSNGAAGDDPDYCLLSHSKTVYGNITLLIYVLSETWKAFCWY